MTVPYAHFPITLRLAAPRPPSVNRSYELLKDEESWTGPITLAIPKDEDLYERNDAAFEKTPSVGPTALVTVFATRHGKLGSHFESRVDAG
jgi:hypothetical protein